VQEQNQNQNQSVPLEIVVQRLAQKLAQCTYELTVAEVGVEHLSQQLASSNQMVKELQAELAKPQPEEG